MKKKLNKKQVLKKLNISDFSELTKEKFGIFISMLSDMDPEVAKEAMKNYPDFANNTAMILSYYKDIVMRSIDSADKQMDVFNNICEIVLETLKSYSDADDIDFCEREKIIGYMMEILRMQDNKDSEHKKYVIEIIKTCGQVAIVTVSVLAIPIIGLGYIKIIKDG